MIQLFAVLNIEMYRDIWTKCARRLSLPHAHVVIHRRSFEKGIPVDHHFEDCKTLPFLSVSTTTIKVQIRQHARLFFFGEFFTMVAPYWGMLGYCFLAKIFRGSFIWAWSRAFQAVLGHFRPKYT